MRPVTTSLLTEKGRTRFCILSRQMNMAPVTAGAAHCFVFFSFFDCIYPVTRGNQEGLA